MMRVFAILSLVALVLSSQSVLADDKVALVIGNAAYQHAKHLRNPENDATDVAAALTRLHFQVLVAENLTQSEMLDKLNPFLRKAALADVALFYYSGHGIQFKSVNYLMPTDATLSDDLDIPRFVSVDSIVNSLQKTGIFGILVLDACRDNPLADEFNVADASTRSAVAIPSGLASMRRPGHAIIAAFSTESGETASDGSGRNSPYTEAFLRHIESGKEIHQIFSDISHDVEQITGHRQLPEVSSTFSGTYHFDPSEDDAAKSFSKSRPEETEGASASPPRTASRPFKVMLIGSAAELQVEPSRLSSSIRRVSVGEILTVDGEADSAGWYMVSDHAGNTGYIRKNQVSRIQ